MQPSYFFSKISPGCHSRKFWDGGSKASPPSYQDPLLHVTRGFSSAARCGCACTGPGLQRKGHFYVPTQSFHKETLKNQGQGNPEVERHELVQKRQMAFMYDITVHSYTHGKTSLINQKTPSPDLRILLNPLFRTPSILSCSGLQDEV